MSRPDLAQFRNLLISYWPVLVLVGFYLPALSFGYLWDDHFEVVAGWDRLAEKLPTHPRVFYYLSFALTNPLFDAAWQHRLFNLVLFAGAMIAAFHAARHYELPYPALLILAIYSHPVFVYPVTFISQRNDLFLQLFVMLTLIYATRRSGIVALVCSNVSKSPWAFQNIWYIWKNWRTDVPRIYLVVAGLLIVAIVAQGLVFWEGVKEDAHSPMMSFSGGGLGGIAFVLAVRAAKIAEGLFMVHVPFQAYYSVLPPAILVAIVAGYLALWLALLVNIVRRRGILRTGLEFVGLTLLMSIPFAANSDPRVIAPAVPFVVFAWVALAGRGRTTAVALSCIALLNLGAALANYHLSDSGYDQPTPGKSYVLCGEYEMQIPMDRWRCERADVARSIVVEANKFLRSN